MSCYSVSYRYSPEKGDPQKYDSSCLRRVCKVYNKYANNKKKYLLNGVLDQEPFR